MRHALLNSTILAFGLLSSAGALAQTGNNPPTPPGDDGVAAATDAAGAGADVTVTARKRDEKLIDVPISIQAFSRAEIKTSGIDDLQTLKDRAGFQLPEVLSTSPTGRYQGTIIFRGLQASSFGAFRDNSGSLFVDGIFISGGQQSVNTADVERIEVLKGPQNAFFGRNTFGGLVNFITRNPSEEFHAEINTRATLRASFDGDASIEGGIVPGLLNARLTVVSHDKAPEYFATDRGELGAETTQSATGTLYFTPAHNLWVRIRGTYQYDDDSTGDAALLIANNLSPVAPGATGAALTGNCAGRTFPGFNGRTGQGPITLGRNYFCNGLPTLDQIGSNVITANTTIPFPFQQAIDNDSTGVPFFNKIPHLSHAGLRRTSQRYSYQAGYTFDSGASFAFNAGFNKQDSAAIYDIDRTDIKLFLNERAFRTRDLTVDGRFLTDPTKRIRLLLGGSYYQARYQEAQIGYNYGPMTTTYSGYYDNELIKVPAVYGSIDFDLLKTVTLTGEARYQWDMPKTTNLAGVSFQQTFRSFLPRATIKFKPTDNTNLYASFSKGVQPAGFNASFPSLTAPQAAYVQSIYPGIGIFSLQPKLNDYEVGLKQRMFDGRVSFSVAAYQLDWNNAVTSSSLFNPAACFNGNVQTVLTAACPLSMSGTSVQTPNNARIRGVEFEGTALITPAWSINLTADYKDARWRKYANTGFNAFAGLTQPGDVYRGDGNHLARVPDFEGTASSTYRTPISDQWTAYLRGDVLYTGSSWDSDLNIFRTPDYTHVNLRLGFERKGLTLEAFTTNLLNDKTFQYAALTVQLAGNFTQRALLVQPADKREIGIRTQIKF